MWLNMLAYTWESSAEYARTLNVSDVVYSIRSVHKLLSSYQDRHSEHCQTCKGWNVLQKEQCLSADMQPETF